MKTLTCIICPVGCRITAVKTAVKTAGKTNNDINSEVNGEWAISGNKCPKGEQFVITELTDPRRTLTTVVRTAFPEKPVLSVKTSTEVPKEKIMAIICELSGIIINAEIKIGDVVAANILDTGCDIIATSNISKGVK